MQYKICRNCGFKNEYEDSNCSRCGLDMMQPNNYDIENDVDYTDYGESVIRLWSLGLSKFLTVILTIITVVLTVFVLDRYFGETVRESMRNLEIVKAVSDKVGYDISDFIANSDNESNGKSTNTKDNKKDKKAKKNKKDSEYILKNSNKKYIPIKKLKKLSKRKLAIARNEIFARNGYTFKDGEWEKYFKNKTWYKPKYSADYFNENYESLLNKYEKKNIKRIVKVERMKEE